MDPHRLNADAAACLLYLLDHQSEWKVEFSNQKGRGSQRGRSCYVASMGQCGHEECLQANRDYQREWHRLKRAGIGWIDPWIEDALK